MPLIKENKISLTGNSNLGNELESTNLNHQTTVTYSNIARKLYDITIYIRQWYSKKFRDLLDWPYKYFGGLYLVREQKHRLG